MKKLLSVFLIAGLAFGAVSCSSEYDATPELEKGDVKNQLRGEMTAMLNDTLAFEADTKSYTLTSVEGINAVAISGTEFSEDKDPNFSKTITLSIGDYLGPNTYTFGFTAMAVLTVLEDGVTVQYMADAAEDAYITITQDGDKWEGNFQFTARRQDGQGEAMRVMQGKFSIPK